MTVAQPNATGAPGYTSELPCVRESVRHARAFVSDVLAAWDMDDDMADCGKTIVTELLANAVEHTETPASKIIIERPSNGVVRIGVSDSSRGAPHLEPADPNAESGRGLSLVAALSSQWGYDTHPWGKVTWAVIEASADRAVTTALGPKPPAEEWTPPLDANSLRLVLERFRAWRPLDIEEVFDDLDAAIGNHLPPASTTVALIDRLRGHLKQLSDITVAGDGFPPTAEMTRLVQQARPLREECTPAAHRQAVGLARRLAFVTADLIEELLEARCIKGTE
ncbi:DUF6415 family natural product biosynthesis protein [Streptantibioticus parmotrematis]|uniref:DUF6415 family natural product biosynthesis protein n=1 Tax=Streptantibioticus parmotrematis TaxID=2873249 RepID=UPI0033E71C3A